MEQYDIVIVGAGSGGIGAAVTAVRRGLSVLLVEKESEPGGTVVRGGVSTWEPVCGATSLPFEIYQRLKRIPHAAGIYTLAPDEELEGFPGGKYLIDNAAEYADTLRGWAPEGGWTRQSLRNLYHGVIMEPSEYATCVREMLRAAGRCRILTGTAFSAASVTAGRIVALNLDNGEKVRADYYVDATADGFLCRACGCALLRGQENCGMFREPDAPAVTDDSLNGVTLVYRISPSGGPDRVQALPGAPAPAESFPSAHVVQYANGDFLVNMLPTMEGGEYEQLGAKPAYEECCRRIRAHWGFLRRTVPAFAAWRIAWVAPALGVREGERVVTEYVLTENDLLAGLAHQRHPDIIALADHGIDRHGKAACSRQLAGPYGIPYRCLIPKGFGNLLVASRAAGFSSLAASSCRLSRTMMQLGQAAGTAAALAAKTKIAIPEVPAAALRNALKEQKVQLEWPTPRH